MTVEDLFKGCRVESTLKVMSAYNGRVLCYGFNPEKHKEIGERKVCAIWADIAVRESRFEHYARPIMCAYVDGTQEMEEANHET